MDSLTITIIFVAVSAFIGAFIKGRAKDRCLVDFMRDQISLELKDGKVIWGALRLEATGLELKYQQSYLDKSDNNIETSFILYKSEYPNIYCISRFVDHLSNESQKRRLKLIKKITQQKGFTSINRRIRNIFATVRDSIMEVANLLIGRVKQVTPAGKVLSTHDKYVSQMQQGIFSSINTSFEPLLETHLGKKVVLAVLRDGKKIEYSGILRRYTAEFLELMDVDYRIGDKEPRKADIVVPRTSGVVRHLGE